MPRSILLCLVVCLGAVAAQSLMGSSFRITKERGRVQTTDWAPRLIATWHPSAILRAPEPADRERLREQLIHDLKVAASFD